MLIRQRRIINLPLHLDFVQSGASVVLGLSGINRFHDKLMTIGFVNLAPGETVLPARSSGPVSRYNAEGKNTIHRDRPMETAYRTIRWHWIECHGKDRVEQSDWKAVPYQRYPRTFVLPPSIELQIAVSSSGEPVLVTQAYKYAPENEEVMQHIINLFLELFGECEVFSDDLSPIMRSPTRRLNWHILPPGKYPWEVLHEQLKPVIEQAPQGNQTLVSERFEMINARQPDFTAVGMGGFRGYVVFGFPSNNLYLLECAFVDNATYVFGEAWEDLSKLTKAEILGGKLAKDRIIHRDKWRERITNLLK